MVKKRFDTTKAEGLSKFMGIYIKDDGETLEQSQELMIDKMLK